MTARIDPTARTIDTAIFCTKCGCREIQVSSRNKNGYCKACFLSVSTHKFRATLGKSKSMRPNDSILVAHSGKANSTVLLHLMKTEATKRLQFRSKILYIDDGMIKGWTVEERESIRTALAKEAENLRLPMHTVSLSRFMTDNFCEEIESINAPWTNTIHDDALLRETFERLKGDTAKDELLQQLRRKLLVSAARKLGCNKIFVADTSLNLAIRVLEGVSTGRGSQLSFDVGFSDTRCADVVLFRPLRDFTGEDVFGYLQCCDLIPILTSPKYSRSFPASIRSVTENFLRRLDSEFYSTVPTVYRTSEKLTTKTSEIDRTNIERDIDTNNDVDNICILCELSFDVPYSQKEELSVIEARKFSRLVSTVVDSPSNTVLNSSNDDGESKNERAENTNDLHEQRCRRDSIARGSLCERSLEPNIIERFLCYACRLIFSNSNQTFNALPTFLLDKIYEQLRMMRLRKEITDFLL